jgi:indole-3-glycerol phosphate synthase
MSRFSQAISEGDGISIIPVLGGHVEEQAALAETAGAEAVAVAGPDVRRARENTALPVLARFGDPDSASVGGADACVLVVDEVGDDERLDELYTLARDLGLDCAVNVRDEDELERALEWIDPDIVLISERDLEEGEEDLERTLDLLADVPAGKLVISEARVATREQVIALERAGVDAVVVEGPARNIDFSSAVAELVRGSGAHR